ncbi:response regulator transcription factor [uncultured Jannaschia sp.]|uniref:helix-turn-helix transcriptional regulator n=1 Tax=uncultured Jannaschia sp. TaxID=293347 RepID=UPI00262F7D92|nr:response regulator transcription factor [uncultured Jannaschia sp.]
MTRADRTRATQEVSRILETLLHRERSSPPPDAAGPRPTSDLVRLVIADLPDPRISPEDVIAEIRARFPSAQVLFVAPQDGAPVADAVPVHPVPSDTTRNPRPARTAAKADTFPRQFSARQTQVLRGLVRGLSNKAIARDLDLAESTVKVHVTTIYRALGVNSRAAAIALVMTSDALRAELDI